VSREELLLKGFLFFAIIWGITKITLWWDRWNNR